MLRRLEEDEMIKIEATEIVGTGQKRILKLSTGNKKD